jgi:hypothetical protein
VVVGRHQPVDEEARVRHTKSRMRQHGEAAQLARACVRGIREFVAGHRGRPRSASSGTRIADRQASSCVFANSAHRASVSAEARDLRTSSSARARARAEDRRAALRGTGSPSRGRHLVAQVLLPMRQGRDRPAEVERVLVRPVAAPQLVVGEAEVDEQAGAAGGAAVLRAAPRDRRTGRRGAACLRSVVHGSVT